MPRILRFIALVIAGAFLFAVPARAQFTTVTATVVDPNGIPYANGTMSAVLVPNSPGGWRLNGQPYSGRVGPLTLDSTGSFSANFGSNALILPAGTMWQITVNSNPGGIPLPLGTGAQTFNVTMTISGSLQNISATLNAAAPALTHLATGGSVTSVGCTNLWTIGTCTVTNPTTNPVLNFAPVSSGPSLDCSTFPGAPDMGIQLNNCLAALPAAGGIADATHFTSPQTITTAVVNSIPAAIVCGGISITQLANISLTGTGSSMIGAPNAICTLTKGANIDQITMSGSDEQVAGLSLEGSKASFTGNGIVTASGCSSCQILLNTIDGEANDGIFDNSGTFSVNGVKQNTVTGWGVHGFQSTSASQQSIFENNLLVGDGTSTGAAILNGGSSGLYNNYVKDSNGVALVDDSTAAQYHPIVGNRLRQTNGWPALIAGIAGVTSNYVEGGGSHGPALNAVGQQAVMAANTVIATNGDGIDLSNENTATGNIVSMNMSGVSGKCGINVAGDVIGARSSHNQIQISDNAADTNAGTCSTPTGSHNLNNVFDGDHVATTLSGGAIAYGFFMNNAANLNTNWSVIVENLGCVHLTDCLKRTDTQNNLTTYFNINPGDTTFDAGTGSTKDVFYSDLLPVAFASLPSPAGNGSQLYVSDCTPGTPISGSGSGCMAFRQNGQWSSWFQSAGPVTATNCSAIGTAANPSVASCSSAKAGSFSCATNASTGTCVVNTTGVTANSQILVQEDDSLGTKIGVTCNTNNVLPATAPLLGARSGGTSFTINLGTFSTNPLCYSYVIVN